MATPASLGSRTARAACCVAGAIALACSSDEGPRGAAPSDASSEAAGGVGGGGDGASGAATQRGDAEPEGGQGETRGQDAAPEAAPGGAVVDAGDPLLPQLLSETGLYADVSTETLAPDVKYYEPRFKLWTDGATKRRWIHLPAGSTIDATNPDGWVFPVGTKVWKEFTRDGVRVETRLFWKVGAGSIPWRFVAYVWDPGLGDAVITPNGLSNVGGTPHDVPSVMACYTCHAGSPDLLLGVSAVQLAHDTAALSQAARAALGLTLEDLVASQRLDPSPPSTVVPLPGTDLDRRALGVLHANCGHCHRSEGLGWASAALDLHLDPDSLDALEATGAFRTAVGVPMVRVLTGLPLRVEPAHPERSAVYVRMTSRDAIVGMPTLGTEDVDLVGAQTVFDWISALPALDGGASPSDAGDGGDAAPDGAPSDASIDVVVEGGP